METIQVRTSQHEQLIDITSDVQQVVSKSGVKSGVCYIYTPHTTAAITINENADPTVQTDMIRGMKHLALEQVRYDHMEGNSPSHIKSSLFGCSETVLIEDGRLQLGTWQGIYFCEFDGSRNRKVWIKVM